MKYYYVYIHICLVTAKPYIGWATNPKARWRVHCASKDNTLFHKAIRKYGKECFESQIIFRTTNLEEVKQKEIKFIKQFDSLVPNGYNLTKGGDGVEGHHHTKETKEKMRQAKIGTKRPDNIGRNKKEKFAKGKHWKLSEGTIKKQSEATQGKNNPMYGRKNPNAHSVQSKIKKLKNRIIKLKQELKND